MDDYLRERIVQLEARVAQLERLAGVSNQWQAPSSLQSPTVNGVVIPPKVVDLVRRNERVGAVKELRAHRSMSLLDAKRTVDALVEQLRGR